MMLQSLQELQFTVSIPLIVGLIAAYYIARIRSSAIKCAKAGLTVFAGCLTKQGEDSLKSDTKGLTLHTFPLDVTKDESVAEARKFVDDNLKHGIKFWAVVANAGVLACYGPDEWNTIDDFKFAIEVNTFGVIRCVQAFMDLVKKNEGRIVAVSSVCGRVSLPASAPYSVSKYGVEAYIDCIRQETAAYGVKCSLLEPGAFKTALIDKGLMRSRVEQRFASLSPEKRSVWGEEYKEWFLENWGSMLDLLASSNISIVVNNYFHAITAKYPRRRYLCGLDALLFFLPFSFLDARLQDPVFIRLIGSYVRPIDVKRKLGLKAV